MEITLLILAVILALAGVVGSVLPILPGAGLNFIAILILYFLRDGLISIYAIIFFGVLTILAVSIDYMMPAIKAKKIGASKYGLWGLFGGMILGFVVLSFVGMIIGAFLGVIIGELVGGRKMKEAVGSGMASLWGTVFAMVIKLTISVIMTVYLLVKLLSLL